MDLVKNGEIKACVTIHLGGDPAIAAAELFVRKFKEKTGFQLEIQKSIGFDDITRSLQISISSSGNSALGQDSLSTPDLQENQPIPPGGFIADLARIGDELGLVLSAPDLGSLIAAIGEVLRGIQVSSSSARILSLPPKVYQPAISLRGVCLDMSPESELYTWDTSSIETLIEEWALWGIGSVMVHYHLQPFRSDFRIDPENAGSRVLKRMQTIASATAKFGLKFGLSIIANEAYYDRVMVNLRSKDDAQTGRRGGSPTLLCPSQHQARNYLIEDRERLFRDLTPIHYLWISPYHPGGCWCQRCTPWIKTFLGLSQEIARTLNRYHSEAETFISSAHCSSKELEFLKEYLPLSPDWLHGFILSETKDNGKRRSIQEMKRLSDSLRPMTTVLFNPSFSGPFRFSGAGLPFSHRGRLGCVNRLIAADPSYSQLLGSINGLIPTSDSFADDFSKIAAIQLSWQLALPLDTIAKNYCSWYFETNDPVADSLFRSLDPWEPTSREISLSDREKLLSRLAKSASSEAKASWRWTILQARIDLEKKFLLLDPDAKFLLELKENLKALQKIPRKSRLHSAIEKLVAVLRERTKAFHQYVQAVDDFRASTFGIEPQITDPRPGAQLLFESGRSPLDHLIQPFRATLGCASVAETKSAIKKLLKDLPKARY